MSKRDDSEEARAQRLKQMRESQRLLKQKRTKEVDELRHEVQRLKDENAMYLQAYSDYGKLLGILDICGLNSDQFEHLLSLKADDPFIQHKSNYSPIDAVAEKYRGTDFLFTDGIFLLQFVAKCMTNCLNVSRRLNKPFHPSHKNGLKFVSIYGLGLVSTFYYQCEKLDQEGLIHNDWLRPDKNLPPNTMDLFAAIDYLLIHFNPDTMLKEVMFGFLARFTYPTAYGPVIYQIDVEITLSICQSARFDEAFLLGTMDSDKCVHEYISQVKTRLEDSNRLDTVRLEDSDRLDSSSDPGRLDSTQGLFSM